MLNTIVSFAKRGVSELKIQAQFKSWCQLSGLSFWEVGKLDKCYADWVLWLNPQKIKRLMRNRNHTSLIRVIMSRPFFRSGCWASVWFARFLSRKSGYHGNLWGNVEEEFHYWLANVQGWLRLYGVWTEDSKKHFLLEEVIAAVIRGNHITWGAKDKLWVLTGSTYVKRLL